MLSRIRRGDRVDHCEAVRRQKDATLIDVADHFANCRRESRRRFSDCP